MSFMQALRKHAMDGGSPAPPMNGFHKDPDPDNSEVLTILPITGHAAGIMFVSPIGQILLCCRDSTEKNYGGYWSLPGGKAEAGETPAQAAIREAEEELGEDYFKGDEEELRQIDVRISPTGMAFHTFAYPVDGTFNPELNDEHSGFMWADLDHLPHPMHPGVLATIQERLLRGVAAADMKSGAMDALKADLAAWTRSKGQNPAKDKAPDLAGSLGMDESARSFDIDGRMHVSLTHISKANVCPYRGREIPDASAMSLDPDRIYMMYRHPEELAKGAPTFNNLPLLSEHVAVTADTHPPELTVGSTGTDAIFVAPYLDNSLVIWTRDGIDVVEEESKKELSCAYRYRADMVPGVTPDGQAYDGVMRDIIGNHVALVSKGRAGPDVVVGDSAIRSIKEILLMSKKVLLSRTAAMAKGALSVALLPKLAQDQSIDLTPMLADVNASNFKDKKAGIFEGIKKALDGKLAKDASLDSVKVVLDAMEEAEEAEAMDGDPENFLKGKLSAEDKKSYDAMCEAAKDKKAKDAKEEDDEDEKKKKAEDEKDDEKEKDMKKAEDKKAMDEAITGAVETAKRAVRTEQRALRDAERAVKPWVGEIAVACDSAEEVYKAAFGILGVDVKGVDASAFPAILKAQPLPGKSKLDSPVALDAASVTGFNSRFADADRIQSL